MNNMKKSEKILAAATLLVVLLYVGFQMVPEDAFGGFSGSSEEVEQEERRFSENLGALGNKATIERRFATVGVQEANADSKVRPALAFQEEVSQIVNNLGFRIRSINVNVEEIDKVEDYELINVAIRTEGQYDQTIQLLRNFQGASMMFRELEIVSGLDRDTVEMRATVSRISEVQRRIRKTGTSKF